MFLNFKISMINIARHVYKYTFGDEVNHHVKIVEINKEFEASLANPDDPIHPFTVFGSSQKNALNLVYLQYLKKRHQVETDPQIIENSIYITKRKYWRII